VEDGALTAQEVLDACFSRQGENPGYSPDNLNCQRIERDPFSGGLARVETPYSNRGGLRVSGMDYTLSWSAALEDLGLGLPGRLSTSLQAQRQFHDLRQATEISAPLENVGFSNLPKWRTATRVSYLHRGFSAGIHWRYQEEVRPGVAQTNPNTTTIGGPSYSRFDGNLGYRFRNLRARLSISNLFNKEPPPYGYSPWTTGSATRLPSADDVGRRYTVTVSMDF
jgi:iron complex outermembrane receptor protein